MNEHEWQPTFEKATPLHIGPSTVIVNGEDYVPRSVADARLMKVLVVLYGIDAQAAARLCDDDLDRSGALLGRLRDAFRASSSGEAGS